MNRNRHKISWTIAAVALAWVFAFLPTAEDLPDAEPHTTNDWIIFAIMNLVALIAIHRWVSEQARQERDLRRRAQRQMRINAQRYRDRERAYQRRNHPTSR